MLPDVSGKGPDAREGHSAALVGKKLFIFGGCGKSEKNIEIYYDDLFVLDTGIVCTLSILKCYYHLMTYYLWER